MSHCPLTDCPDQCQPTTEHHVLGRRTSGTGAALRQRLGSAFAPARGLQTETTFLHTLPGCRPARSPAGAATAASSCAQDPSWQTILHATAPQCSRQCWSPALQVTAACPKRQECTCGISLPTPASPLPRLGKSPAPQHQLLVNPLPVCPVLPPNSTAPPVPCCCSLQPHLGEGDVGNASQADHLHPAGTETSAAVSPPTAPTPAANHP